MIASSCNHSEGNYFLCCYDESVTFVSNVFKVSFLVEVMVLLKVSLAITTPKQVVLV
jgi:hypothetical protein